MPAQFRMPVPAAAEKALGELAARAAALAAASGGNLLECFAAVPDPRDPRGIRHSVPCVLALCTAAVLCGNTAVEDVTRGCTPPRRRCWPRPGPGGTRWSRGPVTRSRFQATPAASSNSRRRLALAA